MQYRNPADRGGSIRLLCLIVAALPFGGALAEGHQVVEEVVSIGTRGQGRTALDSPVPVDSLSDEQMRSTGQTEVGRMLQVLAPSFNFSSSSISDGTDALRPATLRGLGPDQTLVLVNGKRRHGSALIHVNTSVGRGTAGTDLNAIPASSIKRIEVLRDGAAAQYGSDAIAGVINLVLKDYAEGGEFSASYGQYTEGDGESKVFSYNQGLTLLDDGYLNFGVEYRDRGSTNRAGLTGVCQYDMCTDIGGGVFQTSDPRELIFDRQNFRIGDADSDQLSGTVNLSVPFDNGLEGYAFATYSQRDNTSGGFYRRANQPDRNPSELFDGTPINADGSAFYPDGFLPLINTDIEDQSYNAGLRGQLGEWEWDAGVGYAMNEFAFNISNSVNASLVSATGNSPTSADAGTLKLGLTTFDVDFTRPMDWGNLAFGAAYREDEYEINPGELVSYADFDTINGVSLGANDAAGGIQVFRGFSPDNVVDEDRSAWSLYVDAEYDQIDRWLLGAAVRHEDYDDFGSTTNGKLTASFELSETVRFRGAISTGFRAPSLQQQFFNSTSTQFVSDGMGGLVAEERGTFRNDSELAMGLGIPRLEEETSTNVSLGVVLQPTDNLNVTIDVYQIQIDDRIVISGSISRDDVMGIGNLEQAFIDAGANSAQFFLNAADTTTDGIDIVADWGRDMWGGDLGITFAANFTDTDIDSVKSPESLSTVPGIQDSVFTSQDRSILTDWQPESRMNLTGNFGRDSWRFKLAANRYGEYTVQEGSSDRQTFGSEILIDTQFAIDFDNGITFKIGGNNIFDATPDKNEIGQSRGGVIVDGNGDTVVDSPGV
ncbi:MAG: TonB-dependent receptor, partial [Gammaproteobacteria bacterium]|nr:TonB-dependent receptor [Gammaproteobacteria bacterium]